MIELDLRKPVNRLRRRLTIVLLLGISLVATGVASWLWKPRQTTYQVRVSGGVEKLNRHGVAKYLERHASEIGLEIELLPSEGTVEATRLRKKTSTTRSWVVR